MIERALFQEDRMGNINQSNLWSGKNDIILIYVENTFAKIQWPLVIFLKGKFLAN